MSVPRPRLLLLIPPQTGLLNGFANGLISLGGYLREKLSYLQVTIVDLSAESKQSMPRQVTRAMSVIADCTLFVGITTTTASYQSALIAARHIKSENPKAVVIFGGHHASADAETILAHHRDLVDYVVIGEGERVMLEFFRAYPEVAQVPGLAYLSGGRVITNPQPPFLTTAELDAIPVDFPGLARAAMPGKFDHVTYVAARGCPLQCSFCSVANERIRAKSTKQVTEDIRTLVKRGYSRIAIEDNFFAHSPRRTRELCVALSRLRQHSLSFTWDCQTRVESMARSGIIPMMAEAGCEAVYLGVESLNPDHLLYLNKTPEPKRYLDLLLGTVAPSLFYSPIDCYINLQLGLPSETFKHADVTTRTLADLGQRALANGKVVTVFPQLFVVYPGTHHFRSGIQEGLFQSDVFETFTKWEMEQLPVLRWLGLHFAHGTGGLPLGILNPESVRRGEYAVESEKVLQVSSQLKAMEGIPGIKVFNYGQYLMQEVS